ncbi:glycosyltransferase family 4 protein [Psychrobacillus sp. NPDC058041]|uniref:glycosyltransferase family 4 protein n=1 Tax=Psychrobacillus sp. NPDC058041 TaxID=3346310 RepID=UPI0036DB96DF
MRILHLSNDYFNSTIYRNLHQKLLLKSIDSHMFIPSKHSEKDKPKEKNVYQVKCYKQKDRYFYFLKQRKIFNNLKKNVKKIKPDALHAHFIFSSGYACMKIKKKYAIPYLVAVRNTDVNFFFKRMFHLRRLGIEVMLNSEKIIFLSPTYRDLLINKYIPKKYRDIIMKKSIVLPNGIDNFWLTNTYLKERVLIKEKTNLLTVGAININKNQLTVAKASQKLINEGYNIEYTIIGKIEDKNVYKKLRKYKFIKFVGQQSKENLKEYFRSADIFVMPSIKETFGLVYAEAMSQGVPVIYSKMQGFDKQFIDGKVGYSVNSLDEIDIAERILAIVGDYGRISKACVLNSKVFDWEDISKEYINLYNAIKNR